ncbi:17457_t:CDS:2 [Funneliformis caledonium]|uniref:17457_t:CDS:1 n=1 Tax=Funneliformis caledonium TaxID=1117310 RepID=A0A9N9AEZ6_9GLOM|nr:17457_t:CDS:2 [Funneliformis caledonium]
MVKNTWNAIDPFLIRRSFKCYEISNKQNESKEYLIFDYYKVARSNTTNQSNYIYLNDEIDDQKNRNIEIYLEKEKNNIGDGDKKYEDGYYKI